MLAPEAEVALVILAESPDHGEIAGLEVVTAISCALGDRILEEDVVGAALGGEAVAVPVVRRRAGVLAVEHGHLSEDDVVHGVIEVNTHGKIVTILALRVAIYVLDEHLVSV